MAKTVNEAFNKFLADTVNLDPDKTKKARGSRDWLVGQIETFPDGDTKFPSITRKKTSSLVRSTGGQKNGH